MIAIRTKNLSPLFSDILGFKSFLESLPGVSLVISPRDGVDWELSGSIPDHTTVYSLIPHIKGSQETIKSHELALGVHPVIPLYPVSDDYTDIDINSDCGLYQVEDVEDIETFKDKTEKYPDCIRISINPLKYPKEVLDFCKVNNIKIIGGDIFGPCILREYYKCLFPETFLQAFGEYNTNILEIPGDDPYLIKRVYSRLDKGQENTNLLVYSKNIDRVPNLKASPKVYQTLELDIPDLGKLSIPNVESENFSLKKKSEILEIGEPLWEDDLMPEDIDYTDKELLGVLHRYHVLPKLQELHSPKVWKPVFTKIYPDFWAIKVIPKKWYGWFWGEHYYWFISGKLWKIPLSGHKNLINGKA